MNDKRKLFAAVLVALMASLPASCLLTGADAGDDGGPASPYDQLTANEKAVYDGIASYSAGKLTVTVALANPVYTASATDGDAEAYLEAEAASMIKAASYVLSMEDPFAICTWGGSGVVFDLGSQTVVRTGGLIGLDSLVLTAVIDEAYADDPATEDVDELQERIDALDEAVAGFTASGGTRDVVGAINGYLVKRLGSDDGTDVYADDAYGALVSPSKRASSEGFAKGFQALALAQGIDCLTVLGYTLPGLEKAAWNTVVMDDGGRYPVDVAANKSAEGSALLASAAAFNAGHSAGRSPSDGGIALDFPPLNEDKYDADPWYDNKYVEWAVLGALAAAIIAGILLAVRGDRTRGIIRK